MGKNNKDGAKTDTKPSAPQPPKPAAQAAKAASPAPKPAAQPVKPTKSAPAPAAKPPVSKSPIAPANDKTNKPEFHGAPFLVQTAEKEPNKKAI